MTVAYRKSKYLHRTKYKCDICGKIDYWDEGWSSYGTLALQETCPEDIPNACSDECYEQVEKNIETGKFKLPVLKDDTYYFTVVKERVGY